MEAIPVAGSVAAECALYFAPSTIPGAGFGLFAGRSFKEDEVVTPGDVVVPMIDLLWHNDEDKSWLINEYTWEPGNIPGMRTREGKDASAVAFGVGAAVNCFYPMINIDTSDSETQIDSAGLLRSKDPGAGAFTPYHNHTSLAYRDIQPGQELFVDYGCDYFRKREAKFGPIPCKADYKTADILLKRFSRIQSKLSNKVQESEEADICSTPDSLYQDLFQIVQSVSSAWPSRTLRALPDDPRLIDTAVEVGTASEKLWTQTIRDLDWLKENGSCMDKIRAGISTIEQAGRGAFAARPIRKGELVAPVPLIHMANRTDLLMFEQSYNARGDPVRNSSAPSHYQLYLNYCFGHRHSSILLCPYGVVTSLINHSKEKANTRIVWSRKSSSHFEWLKMPPKQWVDTNNAGLAFDFIATCDIEKGEEIFIDYGDEWEAAWKRHVATWKPHPAGENRKDSRDYVQPWSFRHDMRIPNEIMPGAWMDPSSKAKKESKSSSQPGHSSR